MSSQIFILVSRPSFYNFRNYTWAEVGTYAAGNAKPSSEPMTCHSTKALALEIDDPYGRTPKAFISLAQAIGLNEPQHRRTPSSHIDMSDSVLKSTILLSTRFLDDESDYHRGTPGYDSALPDPGATSKINMKATILASLWQHVPLWLGFFNIDTISPGSLWNCFDWTTDARWLNCSECNHTRCENCQRKRISCGV